MSDLRDHEAELVHLLERLGRRTRFAEVMADRSRGLGVRLDKRSTTLSPQPRLEGAIVRAWGGERWVEAATSDLSASGTGNAAEVLDRQLEKASGGHDPPGESATTRGERTEEPAQPMRDMDPEEMIGLAKDAFGWATAVPGIRDTQVHVGWTDQERFYLNSAGARCFQRLSRVIAGVAPLAFENGRVEFDFLSEGGIGGREQLRFLTEEKVTFLAKGTLELLHAKAPPAGEMTVLLDPSVAGTMAHESFGHGTEADQFLRDRSYLKPLLGETLGPDTLTIVDDGAYPGGWGTIYFDDEGHPGQKTVLVDRGRFVGALHDRETAAAYRTKATGNTRRADFLSRAFVRMTNTYVEPGDWTLDELVREAKNGVLLERATSGIEDPQGGQMQLKVKKGRKIENGQLTDLVTSMALSGKVLDFLRATRGISRRADFELGPGYCGKGHTDLLPAGTGGTYLLSTAVVGTA